MGLAKVTTHQRRVDRKGPWQAGLLLAVSLSSFGRVPAPPCYQHCSWELVQCLAGPASSQVVGVTPSLPLIRLDTTPPRIRSKSSASPLNATNLTNEDTCIFSKSCEQCNLGQHFIDKVQSAKTVNFHTHRKFVLLQYVTIFPL